ncbi:MAG TPA: molecular chaperone HtpG [Candidatus Hydrogenedentes bacterium]|nr:molecular chaperone HtpG [Candidatus Hydrogenedentota bacterium]
MTAASETFEFRTEAKQVLDLMIHSVYSNKDIFLRELISNSSDALDKRRFEAVKNPDLASAAPPEIWIAVDKEKSALSVADNGIGMSRDEVKEFIGTIAKSGAQEFLKLLRAQKGQTDIPELIGQFGVGFYSTFMVADRVELVTRRAGEATATRWESAGDGQYTISDAERDEAGTTVTLHLKSPDEEDGLKDYTQEYEIRAIVKRYSDFVAYPIRMNVERTEIDRDEEGKPLPDAQERKVVKAEQLNSMKALWLRDKEEVSEEEYNEFYKHISHDWNNPLLRIQAKMEGTLEYRLLLYIPEKAPFDMMMPQDMRKHGLHLYIKRVFIMDDCTELLPDYLRFVRGVVDSEDLPLNISREMLQENRQVQRMSKGLVGKILAALKEMSEKEPEKYKTFWQEFGRTLKEGVFQDPENKDAILELMRVNTTTSGDDAVSLAAYVERMPAGQDAIYYITGESQARLLASPHLEAFRDRGYEVLLLSDPVDEVWTQYVSEYKEKPLKAIGKGEVDLGASSETEKEQAEKERAEQSKEYAALLDAFKSALDEYVKEVRLSGRLTESPACLVLDEHDVSPQLEKMLRMMGQDVPTTKRILELNPKHPLIEKLKTLHEKDSAADMLKPYAELLYGQALLAEGGQTPDPAALSKHLAGVMLKALENG